MHHAFRENVVFLHQAQTKHATTLNAGARVKGAARLAPSEERRRTFESRRALLNIFNDFTLHCALQQYL